MNKRRVAVIGGGIFGVTISCKLAKDFSVDLYEKGTDILQAASGINQYRLHRGYHYPRSPETVLSSLLSETSFRQEYQSALVDDTDTFYFISTKNSKTSAKDYLKFLNKYGLDYQIQHLNLVNKEKVDLSIKVRESLINPVQLRKVAWQKLKKSSVNVILNTYADQKIYKNYDYVIVCTYAYINKAIGKYKNKHQDYQYELCEKIVVRLPKEFQKKSIVILDGPFMCIDPFGRTGMYVMGNVVHAIHKSNIGKHPRINKKFSELLNKGVIKNPPFTNFKKFIASTEEFISKIKYAKYFGSMFTYRTVLPNKDKTDERPTIINKIDHRIYTVFSGKIVSCVSTARDIAKILAK
ncbi:FAD-binding oxidoreductase [Candidatus Daviesbacteria bacterium]|nr:FAD-binding oxidoreductase [Candidatus Daviesbacteria bacterium]